MAKLIKDIVREYSFAEFDRDKLESILNFYQYMLTKNDEHIGFFGSNTVGVYQLRWVDSETHQFIEEICEIEDYDDYQNDIWDVREVDKRRKVSGNVVNYLFPWLIHNIINSKVDRKLRERASMAVLSLWQIKYLSSLDSNAFRYKGDPAISHAVYENLTKKTLMKREGSWKGVIEYRSENLLHPRSTQYDAYKDMDDNGDVVKLVNDVQTRVRKGYQGIVTVYHDLKEKEERIISRSSFNTLEGEKTLKEMENDIDGFQRTMHRVMLDEHDLIKDELAEEILNIVGSANEKNLVDTLQFISKNIDGRKKKYDLMPEIYNLVIYIFDFIRRAGISQSNMPVIIGRLLSAYRSHRTKHPYVIDIKEKLDGIIPEAISARHEATRAGTKVAVLVYLSARILSVPYYNR